VVNLTPGTDGQAAILLKGKGADLRMPTLPLTAPVTVQLQAASGQCWSASYSQAIANSAVGFRASSD
jgi:hypothetical protein